MSSSAAVLPASTEPYADRKVRLLREFYRNAIKPERYDDAREQFAGLASFLTAQESRELALGWFRLLCGIDADRLKDACRAIVAAVEEKRTSGATASTD
jgi:hypothetical protein